MGELKKMQPSLFHIAVEKDVVYTPNWLAFDMVSYFSPAGICLDPCVGDGAFYQYLPANSEWCEIEKGRDFYSWTKHVDWIIGNPPYSHLLAWIRYSFTISKNVCYLIPLHRAFASAEFLRDMRAYGGIVEIREYGTGTDAGFPFGHALCAVHYQAGYKGKIKWSYFDRSE